MVLPLLVCNQPVLIFMKTPLTLISLSLMALVAPGTARATRIEELCDLRGVRPNQLIGYGLVVGLGGTGDTGQARFTVQSTAAMLRRLGATIDPHAIQTKNAAAVMVTATLPPYSSPGSRIDVVVSSLGNAKSIEGGTLLQTPLLGADRYVYAVAQGPLLVGGFVAEGAGGSVRENHPTVGRVPMGGIVERPAPTPEMSSGAILLQLRNPSFITATRIVEAINSELGSVAAHAIDSGTVRLQPSGEHKASLVALIARVQALDVEADSPVRIVIDERTGTVVLGAGVRIGEVAIAQGGLTVQIVQRPVVSQPNAFGQGQTKVVEQGSVNATVASGSVHHLPASASLSEVVEALNALGARPHSLIAIFQALRASGALQAEIEVQ
jgi:flagellar P-ring protein precursor FlgI